MRSSPSRQALTIALTLLLGMGVVVPIAAAADEDASNIYLKVVKSTTWILSPRGKTSPTGKLMFSTGTGSLVDRKLNLILTNYHVVGDSDEAIVVFPIFQKGKLLNNKDDYRTLINTAGVRGKVIARDNKKDMALIQLPVVPEGVPPLRLSANPAMPGQNIHSIGNPGVSDSLWVYTPGKVRSSATHKKWKAAGGDGTVMDFEAEVLVTTSPTNPGDSGGPLVNDRGELVGITQGGATEAQSVSYFIDLTEIKPFLHKKGVKVTAPPAHTIAKTERPAPEKTAEGDSEDTKAAPKTAAADQGDKSEKAEKDALRKLKLAKQLAADGLKAKAKERLEAIIEEFPMTKAASEAKQILGTLK